MLDEDSAKYGVFNITEKSPAVMVAVCIFDSNKRLLVADDVVAGVLDAESGIRVIYWFTWFSGFPPRFDLLHQFLLCLADFLADNIHLLVPLFLPLQLPPHFI